MAPIYIVTVGFPLWFVIRPVVGLTSWSTLITSPIFVEGLVLYYCLVIFLVLWRQGWQWDFSWAQTGQVGGIYYRGIWVWVLLWPEVWVCKIWFPKSLMNGGKSLLFLIIAAIWGSTSKFIYCCGEANASVFGAHNKWTQNHCYCMESNVVRLWHRYLPPIEIYCYLIFAAIFKGDWYWNTSLGFLVEFTSYFLCLCLNLQLTQV